MIINVMRACLSFINCGLMCEFLNSFQIFTESDIMIWFQNLKRVTIIITVYEGKFVRFEIR